MLENICSYSMDNLYANQQPENPIGYGLQKLSNACLPEFFGGLPVESNSTKEVELSGTMSKSISPAASTSRTKRRNSPGRCNKKNMKKEGEKEEQVVHVRAKRGQATDNHSKAERVRREKINSRLKCLQEIVPGCHKSMGMAVMLDEIINYVYSLQNQVEFLSMELTAASYPSNISINTFPPGKPQETNSPESQELQKWSREGFGSHYSTWSI